MDWFFDDFVKYLFLIAYFITVFSSVIVILLDNRSPYKAISWILVIVLIPIVGIIFYFLFGEEVRKIKIISKKSIKRQNQIIGYYDVFQKKSLEEIYYPSYLEGTKELLFLLYNNSNAVFYRNNLVKLLNNGEDTFSEIFSEIEKAKHHIHLEYYIFDSDVIGVKLKNLLIKKSKEGVEVRIIVDGVGSWKLRHSFFSELKENGIEIYSFLKVRFPYLSKRVNNRNHRKIVVVDGHIGFTGGINISKDYVRKINRGIWRDTHLKITGDAVKALQSIFLIDWYFVARKELVGHIYYPQNNYVGDTMVQVVSSAPDSDWENIMQAYIKIITNAKKYIYIHTPYFIPTDSVLCSLKIAALSNVDVRIIIPKKSDLKITRISSRSYIQELLEAGVKFYQYKKGFLHSKALVVDDLISSVGTANMDFRSFEQNFEVNAFVYNPDFAAELKCEFEKDFKASQKINIISWKKRSIFLKIIEAAARILSPLL